MEYTEQRLAKVESLQRTLAEMQRELTTYREALSRKLGLLENNAVATTPPPRRDSKQVPVRRDSKQLPIATANDDEPGSEQRTAVRRKGNPVPVLLSNDGATIEPFQGWVLDRSTGGLRILVDQPVGVGTVLSVRPSKTHGSFPWIQIKVRSCKPERTSYAIGVQFVVKPAWGEMQAFG
ncbi:hypothetical protein AYO44_02970 [Planctomycetaceae bacterium SCGC AG-212-F19]|nr:hypothetical protein AYO44_02970 [Planctomycetaceae bacterium SCGC AG-212-F19]